MNIIGILRFLPYYFPIDAEDTPDSLAERVQKTLIPEGKSDAGIERMCDDLRKRTLTGEYRSFIDRVKRRVEGEIPGIQYLTLPGDFYVDDYSWTQYKPEEGGTVHLPTVPIEVAGMLFHMTPGRLAQLQAEVPHWKERDTYGMNLGKSWLIMDPELRHAFAEAVQNTPMNVIAQVEADGLYQHIRETLADLPLITRADPRHN